MRNCYLLAALLLLLRTSTQKCTDGCLKCGASQACVICDFTSGYILKSGECQKIEKKNCIQMSGFGQCLVCAMGYYVDAGECVSVPTEKKIKF